MKRLIALLVSVFTFHTTATLTVKNGAICTPVAQGYETLDDAPAINDAIKTCGSGGTILIPQDTFYSIRSPIDFSPCKDCDFQLEGTLVLAQDDWAYWATQRSVLKIESVHGAKIRSLTGQGVIDGNSISYYYRDRWTQSQQIYNSAPHLIHITNASSNITVANLRLKNARLRFFRVENATKLDFSRLDLTVEQQYPVQPIASSETFGFEMGDVSDVAIQQVNMEFRARYVGASDLTESVGVCIAFDKGTNGVTVKDVYCKGAWGGVGIMIETMTQALISGYNYTTKLSGHGVSNVRVENLTFHGLYQNDSLSANAGWATGWHSLLTNETISNITWDGVTVVNASAAVAADRCYLRCRCFTAWYPNCVALKWMSVIENVRFKNFKGKVGSTPQPNSGCEGNNGTVCDIQFEGWTPS